MTSGEAHSYWCRCRYGCDSFDALREHHQVVHDELIRFVNLKGEVKEEVKLGESPAQTDGTCPYCQDTFRSVKQHILRSHKEETP